jgi:aldose 1-epimerase
MYTLKNNSGIQIKITSYGGIITSIIVPDRDGKMADIVLGYKNAGDYKNAIEQLYFGAIIGRYGNRIANGHFSLDGKTYSVAKNNGENHLHGGTTGFDKVDWDARFVETDNAIELIYLSEDGEEGYPGNLRLKITYRLTHEDELVVDYYAVTDKATPVNLTQHSYFNLKGEGNGSILDHELMLNSGKFTPVNGELIPTGNISSVEGTPFDFTSAKTIGLDINQNDEQLSYGGGYDHNWILDKTGSKDGMSLVARVYEPGSGRCLEVHTTEPGVQLYSGNFLNGRLKGKSGKTYQKHGGFCLETQHYPDSPNRSNFPSTILRPGEEYLSTTVFKFMTR